MLYAMQTAFRLFLIFSFFYSVANAEDFSFPGEIEGKVKVSVISQDWGSITWLIENGTTVKKGDVVAKMDTKRVQEKLDGSKEELDKLNEDLKNNKKELEEAIKEEEVNISQIKLERDLARVKWETANAGIFGIELSRLQTDIANAEIEYDKKKLAFLTSTKLHESELVDDQTYQQAKLDQDLAEIDVALRKNALAIKIKDRANTEKLTKLELEAKEIQYQKAEMNKTHRIQKIKFEIDKKEESLINLNDSIKKFEMRLASLSLIAPFDGIVKHKMNQGKLIQIGDRLGKGFAMLDILYAEQKKVVIKIEEKHILKFKLDDEATIKVTDTGETFKGKITRISTTPRDKNESLGPVGRRVSGYSGITVFEVDVSFDDPQSKYKFGFTTVVNFKK